VVTVSARAGGDVEHQPGGGTIDSNTGLYSAPASIAANQKVTVTATSVFDSNFTGTASITAAGTGGSGRRDFSHLGYAGRRPEPTVHRDRYNAPTRRYVEHQPAVGEHREQRRLCGSGADRRQHQVTVRPPAWRPRQIGDRQHHTLSHATGVGEGAPNVALGSQFVLRSPERVQRMVSLPPLDR